MWEVRSSLIHTVRTCKTLGMFCTQIQQTHSHRCEMWCLPVDLYRFLVWVSVATAANPCGLRGSFQWPFFHVSYHKHNTWEVLGKKQKALMRQQKQSPRASLVKCSQSSSIPGVCSRKVVFLSVMLRRGSVRVKKRESLLRMGVRVQGRSAVLCHLGVH